MARGVEITISQSQVNGALGANLRAVAPAGTYRPLGGKSRNYVNVVTGEQVSRRAVENSRRQINFDRRAKLREQAGIPKGPGRGRKGQKVGMRGTYTAPPKNYKRPFTYVVAITRKDGTVAYITLPVREKITKAEAQKLARKAFARAYAAREYQTRGIAGITVVEMYDQSLREDGL